MSTKKFKLLFALAPLALFTVIPPVSALSDIESTPYRSAIEYLAEEKIISGYPDGTFKPYGLINRAELLRILVGATGNQPEVSQYNNCFPDVKSEWFAAYICYAKEKGWVSGYPDGSFKPGNNVNKAEAIKMLVNTQSWMPQESKPGEAKTFTDVENSQWYAAYVRTAKEKEILLETGSKLFPDEMMQRGSISEMIYRAIVGSPSADFEDASSLAVWAQEGGDKVTQDELRATNNPASVVNSVWDGDKIKVFGAKNEVINFNLVLESPASTSQDLNVVFNSLEGPNGTKISSQNSSDLFNWNNRNIELFYVRYLEIKGLSAFMGLSYDQRHLPEKMRTTHDANGNATGGWNDRSNHNKFYPDIAVPLELEKNFTISAGQNQSIWADIYIPKNQSAGMYYGNVQVQQSGQTVKNISVELEVYDFSLPDLPSSKTMLVLGHGDINERYIGERWPEGAGLQQSREIRNQHFKLAHRHKISLIDSETAPGEDRPHDDWLSRLDGSLFSSANGYNGPGAGVGNNVYSIGTYGSWGWQDEGKAGMQQHADNWENWFINNFPNVERFLYLIDESSNYAQIEEWAQWIESSAGNGKNLKSMATIGVLESLGNTPSLDIPTSSMYVGDKEPMQAAVDYYNSTGGKNIFFYNGGRPGQGSFMTDDDGVALRELAWGQYKKQIDRWFYWESTYYNNFQAGLGQTNVFADAHTFGGTGQFDQSVGETGWNYSNGDGVLFYPGTDKLFPGESYDVEGPLASLRLKYWRRGIQDVDYLTLASQKNPAKVQEIVQKIVPKVLWEYDVADPGDPTWVRTEISWSDDPDVWEQARRELAEIIAD